MTDQGRPRPARMSAYATASSHLALLSDLALERVVDQAPQVRRGIGGASATLEAGGVRVFVKQVPVTERELRPGNVRSTANLFGLPGFYQYGLGSAGFGAWRELAAHIMTTNWVLSGEHRAFALLYHWRVLPGPAATEGVFAEFGGLDGAVAHWEGSAAVRDRLQALRDSPARLVLFLEHVPQTLAAWMADRDLSAFVRVDAQLADTTAFMREHGLVHFDAHFLNILTDGHGLYFSDFGLALSDRFDLTGQERAFLREHRCYDRDYTAAHLVNQHLAERVRGERDRCRFVRAWAAGDQPRDVPASAAAILTSHAGTAAVFNDFHHSLMELTKQTPYPQAELKRTRARAGQHDSPRRRDPGLAGAAAGSVICHGTSIYLVTSDELYPADRLEKVREAAGAAGLDAVLLTPGPDLRYVIGYDAKQLERLTCLAVPAGSDPVLFVPRLELAAAQASPAGALALEMVPWDETDDPFALVADRLGAVSRVGVSDRMWALSVLKFRDALPGARLALAGGALRTLRIRKSPAEVAALREAGAAIDRVHAQVAGWLRPGLTERAVGSVITESILAEGHATVDFVIVGSGPNAASPHHEVSDRVMAAGDVVVVDIGGTMPSGYCSDSTRTYALGEPPAEFTAYYKVLYDAQEAACAAVRPGVTAESVDAAAREPITRAGFGAAFIHRTGHGIGLEAHEDPYIVAGNREPLEPGMAFSVEPGIYPGPHGARIEDIVVCTQDGAERLNHTPRELVIAG